MKFTVISTKMALFAAVAMVSTACTQRFIVTAADDIQGRATIIQTVDVKNFLVISKIKDVYWECQEDKAGLRCDKVCDVKDTEGNKIVCPTYNGRASVSR